ncbi:unnamed protein product [Urochloa humidicola]
MQRNYPATCAAEPASLPPASYRLPPPARRLRGWHLLGPGTGARDPFPLQQLIVFRRRLDQPRLASGSGAPRRESTPPPAIRVHPERAAHRTLHPTQQIQSQIDYSSLEMRQIHDRCC